MKDAKRTILLTTHYIEEAERLCDRVAIVDEGKIIAIGTPREIQDRNMGQSRVEIRTAQPMPAEVPAVSGKRQTHHQRRSPPAYRLLDASRAHAARPDQMDRSARSRFGRHSPEAAHARRRLHRAHRKAIKGLKD
jgi:ABC-type multidrug transport system ATPase subunit